MSTPDPGTSWSGGESYERFMGRWSRLASARFVEWLGAGAARDWVDVGCGTGSLARAIAASGSPTSVVGIDPSGAFLDAARSQTRDARVRFVPGSASALPLPDASADVVASAFVLNFLPAADSALGEQARVVRPDGAVAAMVWDYREGMEFLRRFWDAAVALDPGARELDEGVRFPLCAPDPLARLFAEAGLRDVRVGEISFETRFADFADFWEPFMGESGPAPGYVARLDGRQRERLRSSLQDSLEREADGSIRLSARAWTVAGVRAGA